MPLSNGIISSRPQPLPRMPRNSSSSPSPPSSADVQENRGAEASPSLSDNSHANADPAARSDNSIDELDHAQRPVALSREELVDEIVFYLENSMLDAVYGDCLSGARKQRYEPEWPMDILRPQPDLAQPMAQAEAESLFSEMYDAIKEWHLKPGDPDFDEEVEAWQREIGAQVLEYHRNKKKVEPPEKYYGSFMLYHNVPDTATEGHVWSNINLANLALKRGDLQLADQRITAAVLTANQLDYKPIVARCWYWRGVVAHGLGDYESAVECFLEAMPCVGFYQEGELMNPWVDGYKLEMLSVLDKRDAAQGQTAWSRQCRRAILGIDPWFRRFRQFAPELTMSTCASTPRGGSLMAPASEEWRDEVGDQLLGQLAEELDMDEERLTLPRGVDSALFQQLERAAEKSDYVEEEVIYQVLKGFSPAFEKITRYDKFVEGFDNYPDLEGSIACYVLQHGQLLQREMQPTPGLANVPERPVTSESSTEEQSAPPMPNDGESSKSSDGPLTTPTDVVDQMFRSDVTAEKKIAAYEEALSREDHFFDAEKNKRRRELEHNVEWQRDHRRLLDTYEERVGRQITKRPTISVGAIRRDVRNKDIIYLHETWGRDGIRPRTPSPERGRRAQELRRDNEARLKRFKAELVNWSYQRKDQAWHRLPHYRQRFVPRPPRPDSVIEWLQTNTDNAMPLNHSSHSTIQYPITPMGDMMRISDMPSEDASAAGVAESERAASTPRAQSTASHSQAAHVDKGKATGADLLTNNFLQIYAGSSDRTQAGAAVDAISNALQVARLGGAKVSMEQLADIGDKAVDRFENDDEHPREQQQTPAEPAPRRRQPLSTATSSPDPGKSGASERLSWVRTRRRPASKPETRFDRHADADPDHQNEAGSDQQPRGPEPDPAPTGRLALSNQDLRQVLATNSAPPAPRDGEAEVAEEGEDFHHTPDRDLDRDLDPGGEVGGDGGDGGEWEDVDAF